MQVYNQGMTKTIFAFWDEVRELIFYLLWDSVLQSWRAQKY